MSIISWKEVVTSCLPPAQDWKWVGWNLAAKHNIIPGVVGQVFGALNDAGSCNRRKGVPQGSILGPLKLFLNLKNINFARLITYGEKRCSNQSCRALFLWVWELYYDDWQPLSSGKCLGRSTHPSRTQGPLPDTHMWALAQPCVLSLAFSSGRPGPLHSGRRTSEPHLGHTVAPPHWHTVHSIHTRPAPDLQDSHLGLGGRGVGCTPCSPRPPPIASATHGAGEATQGKCGAINSCIYRHTGKAESCCWPAPAQKVRNKCLLDVTTWRHTDPKWNCKIIANWIKFIKEVVVRVVCCSLTVTCCYSSEF